MPKSLPKRFTDQDAARAHLEALQWPEGPICPHCGAMDRASSIKGGTRRAYGLQHAAASSFCHGRDGL